MSRMSQSIHLGMIFILLLTAWPASPAAAAPQSGSEQITSMSGSSSINPVEARRLRFLFWGYAAIWGLLALYIVSLGVRLRGVSKDLERMRQRLGAGGS
jgi:CcmD family protein